MPHIIIDGQRIEAAAGATIIEAAQANGITIPHFCWHPALSVAGNCRMCLVNVGTHKKGTDGALLYGENGQPEVAWGPKLAIACATPVADGMFVDTIGPRTETAQNAVMEFLLINHPLDCPICDEAGQCKLQEYAFVHSNGKSRFDEEKVHKDKRVQLGPQILFDGERCISCSRCIRFADEVAHQPVLTFVQRGDKVTIQTFPGTQFDSPYSMNVIDICPVGALTSLDFRFRARVWEMSFTDSVCPGCARGCNTKVGVMNNEVLRIDPRTNMHVNTYWMCDSGRLAPIAHQEVNRVVSPAVRRGGALQDVTWDEAITTAAELLRAKKANEVMVLGSARASNEDNFALARFAADVLGTSNIDFIKHHDHSFGDSFLKLNDTTPNAIGAHAVGIAPGTHGATADALAEKIGHGITAVVVMADALETHSPALAAAIAKLDLLVVIASNTSDSTAAAHVVLPLASWAESEGTFTNTLHRVQHYTPAVTTTENERFMGLKMSRWDAFGAPNDRWTKGTKRNVRSGWRIVRDLAAALGTQWNWKRASDVFSEIATKCAPFHGMSYDLLDAHQGVALGKASSPDPVGVVYESHVLKPH
jgi:NADH-quinone oxidoreductase subunit G